MNEWTEFITKIKSLSLTSSYKAVMGARLYNNVNVSHKKESSQLFSRTHSPARNGEAAPRELFRWASWRDEKILWLCLDTTLCFRFRIESAQKRRNIWESDEASYQLRIKIETLKIRFGFGVAGDLNKSHHTECGRFLNAKNHQRVSVEVIVTTSANWKLHPLKCELKGFKRSTKKFPITFSAVPEAPALTSFQNRLECSLMLRALLLWLFTNLCVFINRNKSLL